MYYLDYIYPLQFRFHVHSPETGGRGWLLWLLGRTSPLYHAALSLSALHQYGVQRTHGGDRYAELMEYYARALEDLQMFLQQMQESNSQCDVGQQIAVLACGIMLVSFEV